MDPVTQGALGAAWAQPAARSARAVAATSIGSLAGIAPDLDFFIRSPTDPLLAVELHRHFTHALAFIPIGALICAFAAYWLTRRRLSFRACYVFSLLGYASHGLLDACTGYGTLLLWPFSDRRVAFDIVSVIDPLFTVPLIGLVALGAFFRRRAYAVVALAWCLCYLGAGWVQNGRAREGVMALAASRGHDPARLEVKPSLGNILLFKTIYEHQGRYYLDAVRVGPTPRVFPGVSRPVFDRERDLPWLRPDTQQWEDIERFHRFADGLVALDPANGNRLVDLRYSLVPNRADPFWGIELDPAAPPDAHAAYVTMRTRPAAEGGELLRMLLR